LLHIAVAYAGLMSEHLNCLIKHKKNQLLLGWADRTANIGGQRPTSDCGKKRHLCALRWRCYIKRYN